MAKKSFRDCTLTFMDREFGLRENFASSILDQWLQSDVVLTELEKAILINYQELLITHVKAWNEKELSQQFIGPVFGVARLTELYRFRLFAEHKIEATIAGLHDEFELSGEPDGILATGYREPEVPMFVFNEYKRSVNHHGDPAGQALVAMLVGQVLNKNQQPIYGAYVIGSDWRFMVLDGKQYTISRNYSALTDEIFDILRILKAQSIETDCDDVDGVKNPLPDI